MLGKFSVPGSPTKARVNLSVKYISQTIVLYYRTQSLLINSISNTITPVCSNT